MKISKIDVEQVSGSAGFGFADRPGVRAWMAAKGYRTYEDYVRANARRPRGEIQAEIEAHTFA